LINVQPDLFGQCCFIREWGRIGRAGQVRMIPYATADEAQHVPGSSAFEKRREVLRQIRQRLDVAA
jgi:predicted DNA-binding WGR domain protein